MHMNTSLCFQRWLALALLQAWASDNPFPLRSCAQVDNAVHDSKRSYYGLSAATG
jgi:hypothetical protein